jgi:hypothetical protein
MTTNLLSSRVKSFIWRGGAVLAIAGLNYIAENIGLFELPQYAVVIVGLLCGELTKWLSNAKQIEKEAKITPVV